jgi:hypothetical protein
MAHYAVVDENNVVVQVFVGKDENEPLPEGVSSWEQYYSEPNRTCLRTSYNTVENKHLSGGIPFRKNYAGIGFTYDPARDAFIPPKPFNSWILDEETCNWCAPTPQPAPNYIWSEQTLFWVKTTD